MALPIYATTGQKIWHYTYMSFCVFVLFFLVAPLVAVIPLSFTSTPFLNFTPEMLRLDPVDTWETPACRGFFQAEYIGRLTHTLGYFAGK